MNGSFRPLDTRRTVLALALIAAFGVGHAQNQTPEAVPVDKPEAPVDKAEAPANKTKAPADQAEAPANKVEASVSAGVGLISGNDADRALFGQYNGLRTHGAVGLLGFEYSRHNDAAGRSIRVEGFDLLGDTRELDIRWRKPGDWRVSGSYREGVRHDPNTPSNGADLSIKRTSVGIGIMKILSSRVQLDVNLSSENKDGSRLFGIGMNCPSAVAPGCRGTTGTETGWAVLMQPEPISANHSQVEARLAYAGDKLKLSAGYYGSFYRNAYGSFNPNVPGSLNNPLGNLLPLSAGLQSILNQPVALPPDNQSHHLDVAGTYAFTPNTRMNFKLGMAQSFQHQDFAAAGFSAGPTGAADLGGRIDTTLAQVSVSTRPVPKFSLTAKLRYEDRDDRTPIALYNIEDTSLYTNRHLPSTKTRGEVQANYQITNEYRANAGVDFESIDRGVFTATSAVSGITALRQRTDETRVHADVRRRMTDNLSGSIGVESSRRDGTNWLRNNSGLGVTEVSDPTDASTGFSTGIFMTTLADRQRDKLTLMADWQASEALSLQLNAHTGRDSFDTPSIYGVRSNGTDHLSVDANYAWSEKWTVNGYMSYSTESLRQARPAAAVLDYDNRSTALGIGVVGKPNSKVDVGANLSYVNDKSVFAQALDPSADGATVALLAATGGLPDIVFRQVELKVFGRYGLSKQSDVRLDLVHQRTSWNDWSWTYNGVPFVYSDGTTINRQPRMNVTFLGVRYIYRWQ